MTMKRGKWQRPEKIVNNLRDADVMLNAGQDLAVVLQTLAVGEGTYHPLAELARGHEVRGGEAAKRVGG